VVIIVIESGQMTTDRSFYFSVPPATQNMRTAANSTSVFSTMIDRRIAAKVEAS
jgi:hypothetical protein